MADQSEAWAPWQWTVVDLKTGVAHGAAVMRRAIALEQSWVDSLNGQLDSWLRRITYVNLELAWPTSIVVETAVEVEAGHRDGARSGAVVLGYS